jgi:hypothetical protein
MQEVPVRLRIGPESAPAPSMPKNVHKLFSADNAEDNDDFHEGVVEGAIAGGVAAAALLVAAAALLVAVLLALLFLKHCRWNSAGTTKPPGKVTVRFYPESGSWEMRQCLVYTVR